jgi:hypothetical protein
VIGFTPGEHDTHASLGHNPIARELDSHQVQAPGTGNLPDRSLASGQQGDESSHIGRDAALGAGAVGAGGAAAHGLHHQHGDVSHTAPTEQTRSHPLGSVTEKRAEHTTTEPKHATESKGHSLNPFHKDHSDKHIEPTSATQQPSSRIGEQNDSQLGRDAALGAGALGAGGAAAHGLHHQHGDVSQATPTEQSRSHPLGSVTEKHAEHTTTEPKHATESKGHSLNPFHKDHSDKHTESTLASQQPSSRIGEQSDSHLARDAALGAGALGAGGVAAHEHSRHGDDTSRGTIGQSSHVGTEAPIGTGVASGSIRQPDPLTAYGQSNSRSLPTSQQLSTRPGETERSSHLGRDAAIGAGALGAGGLAAHQLSGRSEDNSRDPTHTPTTQGTTGVDRTFPLAGGVTSGHSTDPTTSAHMTSSTHDRELGTKEREVGVHNDGAHGREGLAGAAAAATGAGAGYGLSQHERKHETVPETAHAGQGLPSAQGLAPGEEVDLVATSESSMAQHLTGTGPGHEHDHAGRYHNYEGDPCETGEAEPSHAGTVFAGGPHSTDTANMMDPHLHIPGEFMETPAEEISEPSFGHNAGAGPAIGTAANLRDTPRSGTTEAGRPRTPENHHGRDAAIAGGAGAAGLGALAAGKHHREERPEIGGEQFATESSPYSSKPVDPRLYGAAGPPTSTHAQSAPSSQIPVSSKTTSQRDAAMATGLSGGPSTTTTDRSAPSSQIPVTSGKSTSERDAALATGYSASKHHGDSKENTQPLTTHDEESKHHYGRDAAATGGLGAAAVGAYAATRDNKDETFTSPRESVAPVSKERDFAHTTSQASDEHSNADPGRPSKIGDTGDPTKDGHFSSDKDVAPHRDISIPLSHEGETSQPTSTSKSQDEQSKHHHGREAAAAGGLGAAGAGAYAASRESKAHEGSELHPSSSTSGHVHYPTSERSEEHNRGVSQHHDRDAAVPGVVGTAGAGVYERSQGAPKTDFAKQLSHETPTSGTQQTGQPSQHHYGRDAAMAGGLGAAGVGAYAATQDHKGNSNGPASETIGPHESNTANIIDPRVQPDPSVQRHQAGPTSTSEDPASKTIGPHTSNLANILDPRVKPDPEKQKSHHVTEQSTSESAGRDVMHGDKEQHHHGRDAAVVGGTGAAGYGAYEAGKDYNSHRITQPAASMDEQRYDPSATDAHDTTGASQHHFGRDAAIAGGVGAAGAGAYAATRKEDTPSSSVPQQQYQSPATQTTASTSHQPQHHHGRDTASAGGLGAAGAGTYAPSSGNDNTQAPYFQDPAHQHQRYDSTQQPEDQHNKRDTALGAGAGAGAAVAGAGAYGLSQHDNDKAEKERLAARQKDLDHQRKEEQKALEKRQHDQQKELEKEHHKEERHHDKLVAAEHKKHDKEEAKHEKELEKVESHGGEKKHGLFGFLHRDKSDKVTDPEKTESGAPVDTKHYAGAGAGAGAVGAGAYGAHEARQSHEGRHSIEDDSDGKRERNRLHKDPPPGHPAREAMEHGTVGSVGGKHEHVGTDGPIGQPGLVSGDQ